MQERVSINVLASPVVVGIFGSVTTLNLLQKVAQLLLIQVVIPNEPSLLVKVEGEHGQHLTWSGICKPKYVRLPVVLCILCRRHTCSAH